MINLIPKEDKKKIVRGFYYRLIVLFFAIASVSVLIIFVAILPSYFISSAKNNIVKEKLEIQKNESVPVPDQQTLLVIKDIDKKLSLVENAEKDRFIVSQRVINTIFLKKLSGIKITNITYVDDSLKVAPREKVEKKITIQGNAPSREILLAFRRVLEDDSNFKSVDLPISNFVKGSDIHFYLSLIPRPNDDSVGRASQ